MLDQEDLFPRLNFPRYQILELRNFKVVLIFVTLKKLAQKEDMEMSDKLGVARNLQRQFSSSQDDDADASIADIEDID